MALTLDALTPRAILQDIVAKKHVDLIWAKHPVLTAIKKDAEGIIETVPGHYEYFTTFTLQRPQGIKQLRSTDQAFATKFTHSKRHRTGFKLLTTSQKIQLSKAMMKRTEGNAEKVVAYAMKETEDAYLTLRQELEAVLNLGCAGKITLAAGDLDGSFWVAVDDINVLAQMLGAYVKIYTSGAAPTVKTDGVTVYIADVNEDDKKIKLSADTAVAVADGDWVMRGETSHAEVTSADGDTYPQQFGFPDVMSKTNITPCDTTNVCRFGLDRDTYSKWKGQEKDFSSKVFSPSFFKTAMDLVSNRSNGEVNKILFNTNTETEYLTQWKSKHSVLPPVMTVDGGYEAIKYTAAGKNVPLIVGKYLPDYEFWALDFTSFGIKQLSDPYWSETDGQVLIPSADENVAYAILLYDWNLIGYAPGQNCRGHSFIYGEAV